MGQRTAQRIKGLASPPNWFNTHPLRRREATLTGRPDMLTHMHLETPQLTDAPHQPEHRHGIPSLAIWIIQLKTTMKKSRLSQWLKIKTSGNTDAGKNAESVRWVSSSGELASIYWTRYVNNNINEDNPPEKGRFLFPQNLYINECST